MGPGESFFAFAYFFMDFSIDFKRFPKEAEEEEVLLS